MSRSRSWTIAAAAALMAGCTGAQTKTPVVTQTAEGKSTSPSGDSAAKRGTSMVRFVNAAPGIGDLTVTADKRDLFGNVGFKGVTAYQELSDNLASFSLRTAGGTDPIATNDEAMSDGFRYTIVALAGEKGGNTLRVLRDELVTDSGMARVRVIHGAPGVMAVDVAVQGQRDALFSDLAYGGGAGFKDVKPATVTFEVRQEKAAAHLFRLPRLTMIAGRAYTIILTGDTPANLRAITFDDTVAPTVALAPKTN